MESKINYTGIAGYARSYTEKILDVAFEGKTALSGQELLELTEVRQINLIVLRNIFQKWKAEIDQIKSPYFNYEAAEVNDALVNLMNVLSRHILISREDLAPVLTEAVQQAILLIFSPYDFYRSEFSGQPRKVADLKEEVKFIKVNQHLIQTIIAKAEQSNLAVIDSDNGIKLLNEALEQTSETPEDFESVKEKLSAVQPLDLGQIYTENNAGAETNVHEREKEDTLNERFSSSHAETLADLHQKRKIDSIKNNLTINQRFMFINDLFNGDAEAFNSAIESLELRSAYDEAFTLIREEYAVSNNWDMESESVAEFLEVVAKRFS